MRIFNPSTTHVIVIHFTVIPTPKVLEVKYIKINLSLFGWITTYYYFNQNIHITGPIDTPYNNKSHLYMDCTIFMHMAYIVLINIENTCICLPNVGQNKFY